MTLRRVPPTLAPPSLRALAAGLAAIGSNAVAGHLERAIGALLPGVEVRAFNSGRSALAEAIRVALRATGRRRIVVPAYTSYSVAAAAAAAGAQVDLCDLDISTLSLDRAALRSCVDERTAAVVLGNLFGYPEPSADLSWLRAEGALLIDDAAQALGAVSGGALAGSRGDLGVLSFGRGKCITLGDGGVLLVNDAALVSHLGERPPPATRRDSVRVWALAASVRAAASPVLFAAMSRLPFGRIGESHYEPRFDIGGCPAAADALAIDLKEAIAASLRERREVAAWWNERLALAGNGTVVAPHPGAEPAYLRVPLLTSELPARERVISRLARAGFPYARSYPAPLGSLPAFRRVCGADQPTPLADELAARLVALPCHGGVRRSDVARAAAAVGSAA